MGDARDAAAVNAAVEGADGVISALGASRKNKEPVFTVGTHRCEPNRQA